LHVDNVQQCDCDRSGTDPAAKRISIDDFEFQWQDRRDVHK
jgi:hypothetical protein